MKPRLWTIVAVLMIVATLVSACGSAATPTPAAAPQAAAAQQAAAPTAASGGATAATPTPAPKATATTAPGKTVLSLWTHSAGNDTELGVDQKAVDAFNAQSPKWQVNIEAFPQASYNDSVAAASVANSLPCILDLDGPTVPNFAWSGYIAPLPITDAELKQMGILPADVGRYKDKVYSLGQFDVALLMYARKSVLTQNNIRIPTLDKPWTQDEFAAALKTLKASGKFDYALDLGAAGTGEWVPYAYSPFLESMGGDLVDRSTYLTAEKALNGPEAVKWGQWFQNLFKDGYVNPKPADDQCFLQGHCGLWYTGSWSADVVTQKLGEDGLFLPTVDLGKGPKVGAGSWQWGISKACKNPDGAWEFVKFLMQPQQVAAMSEATGLIPTTPAAAALTTKYKEGGPYRIFYDMASKFAVLRPPTPGYLRISSAFEQAAIKIRDGADVQNTLDDAVDAINRDIKDNKNYGF